MNNDDSLTQVKKYRKKPVEIEAVEFLSYVQAEKIIDWIHSYGGSAERIERPDGQTVIEIYTLEGTMTAEPAKHWIIRGIMDEFYPCDWEIFHNSYDEVK